MKISTVCLMVALLVSASGAFAGSYVGAVAGQAGTPSGVGGISGQTGASSNADRNVVAAVAVSIFAASIYEYGKNDGKPATRVTVAPTGDAKGGQVKLTKTF